MQKAGLELLVALFLLSVFMAQANAAGGGNVVLLRIYNGSTFLKNGSVILVPNGTVMHLRMNLTGIREANSSTTLEGNWNYNWKYPVGSSSNASNLTITMTKKTSGYYYATVSGYVITEINYTDLHGYMHAGSTMETAENNSLIYIGIIGVKNATSPSQPLSAKNVSVQSRPFYKNPDVVWAIAIFIIIIAGIIIFWHGRKRSPKTPAENPTSNHEEIPASQ